MSTLELSVLQIRGLILASAKGDLRYYLNGVLVDYESGLVVSTDGSCLLKLAVDIKELDEYDSVIVPRVALETISKGGKATDIVEIIHTVNRSILARGTLIVEFNPIDGNYPDWQRVVPKDITGEAGQFDPDLLQRITRALRYAMEDKDGLPYLSHNGPSPALLTIGNCNSGTCAVIMPWRVEHA